ncbi:MAG: hypothetical protein WCF40_14950 [Desulfobacterales bacterium]|jgi:hypothetical protein
MNSYNQEQYDTLNMVRRYLDRLGESEKAGLAATLGDYLRFRQSVDDFLQTHFGAVCNRSCYQSRLSACCSRDGIVTFFADVVINVLLATPQEIDRLAEALQNGGNGMKCVYLGRNGCLWHLKPIVCAMFLCDRAEEEVFRNRPALRRQWEAYREHKKRFTWPDRPVLFDDLEAIFIAAECTSPLMYLHNSPGLIRLKQETKKKNNVVQVEPGV